MRLLTRSHWLLAAAACIALAGCGEKKTELGQGGSVVTGSAGPQGAQNAARELVRCDAPVATLALAENPNGYIMGSGYQLPASPVPLVKLLAQQSGCFRVVDRAAGLKGTIQEQELKDAGVLHVEVDVQGRNVHVIVVHLGLIPGSRVRQIERLQAFIEREVPPGTPLVVAGDFNDWGQLLKRLLAGFGLYEWDAPRTFTYPARLPLAQLDHVYARGLTPLSLQVPRGRIWWRMSDHLPLIAEFRL